MGTNMRPLDLAQNERYTFLQLLVDIGQKAGCFRACCIPPKTRKFTLTFKKNSLEGVVFCRKMGSAAFSLQFSFLATLIITSGHPIQKWLQKRGMTDRPTAIVFASSLET